MVRVTSVLFLLVILPSGVHADKRVTLLIGNPELTKPLRTSVRSSRRLNPSFEICLT